MRYRVGTAGWNVPKQHLELFPAPAENAKPTHLQRYAATLNCMEINSSFYRPHRTATWQRWAASTPEDFRFAVKLAKSITHEAKLVNTGGLLKDFFDNIAGLGSKLGPVLVQLPPKLAFDEHTAHEFFTTLRELYPGAVALEPRHASWFTPAVNRLLRDFEVARVAADPPKGPPQAATPAGWPDLRYWRLHGSPRTYYSDYEDAWQDGFLEQLATFKPASKDGETWVVFDNTALGHAAANAVRLADAVGTDPIRSDREAAKEPRAKARSQSA